MPGAERRTRRRGWPGAARLGVGGVLIATGLVTAALWVLSGWYRLRWSGHQWVVRAARGQLFIYRDPVRTDVPDVGRWVGDRWSTGSLPDTPPRFNWWAAPERFPPRDDGIQWAPRDWDVKVAAMVYDSAPASPNVSPARCLGVALWPLPLPACLLGGAVFWSGLRTVRRRRRNMCPRCGYSLSGLTTGACPECGHRAAGPSA